MRILKTAILIEDAEVLPDDDTDEAVYEVLTGDWPSRTQ